MSPEQAMNTLTQMMDKLHALTGDIGREVGNVRTEWAGLGRANGQRADHAAALLNRRIRPALEAIRDFSSKCTEQIKRMHADPFAE